VPWATVGWRGGGGIGPPLSFTGGESKGVGDDDAGVKEGVEGMEVGAGTELEAKPADGVAVTLGTLSG
jgi:hypothetical protein